MLSQYGSCSLTYEVLCPCPPIPGVRLEQTKLTIHVMWKMKLNRPVAYQWAPHKPKIPIPQAHRVDDKLLGVPYCVIGAIWLPYHL